MENPAAWAEAVVKRQREGCVPEGETLSNLLEFMHKPVSARFRRSFPRATSRSESLYGQIAEWILMGGLRKYVEHLETARSEGREPLPFSVFHFGRRTNLTSYLRSQVIRGEFGGQAQAVERARDAMQKALRRLVMKAKLAEYAPARSPSPDGQIWCRADPKLESSSNHGQRDRYTDRRYLPARLAETSPQVLIRAEQREEEQQLVATAEREWRMPDVRLKMPQVVEAAFSALVSPFPLLATTLLTLAQATVGRDDHLVDVEKIRDGRQWAATGPRPVRR